MKALVSEFTQHLAEAIEIAEKAQLTPPEKEIRNIVVLGMGGSGIGGTIAAQALLPDLKIPLLSCKDYVIPGFVSENTLVIVSSYSGNTEETLSALREAEEKTGMIMCITSGGQLKEIAEQKGYGHIIIPGGMPPRAAFGYSFPQIFALLKASGVISMNIREIFENTITLLDNNNESIQSKAFEIANSIRNRITVIYAQSDYEGVSIRFRQQLNENSKKLCWHHSVPEMNHNELVGWREKNDQLAVIFFRNESDLKRNAKRTDLSIGIIKEYCNTVIEIHSKGNSTLERYLYLIHLCDWISIAVAELNEMDPVEIKVIEYLKNELAKP